MHYAITVFQQTDEGIVGKGIHYGPEFENYEDHPWHLKVARITHNSVQFECYKHCQAETLSFTLNHSGELEERWVHDPEENKADWIVRYRRPEQ